MTNIKSRMIVSLLLAFALCAFVLLPSTVAMAEGIVIDTDEDLDFDSDVDIDGIVVDPPYTGDTPSPAIGGVLLIFLGLLTATICIIIRIKIANAVQTQEK